jgi:hypothetical protein
LKEIRGLRQAEHLAKLAGSTPASPDMSRPARTAATSDRGTCS